MKFRHALFGLSCVAAAVTSIQPANATLLNFVLSGVDNATFTLDSNPTPAGLADINAGFNNPYFVNISGTLNGLPKTFEFLTFYNTAEQGGLSAGTAPGDFSGTTIYFDVYPGAVLFGGNPNLPVFTPGTYTFGQTDTLKISAVPEPSTWAMMILGFLGIGLITFHRKKAAGLA